MYDLARPRPRRMRLQATETSLCLFPCLLDWFRPRAELSHHAFALRTSKRAGRRAALGAASAGGGLSAAFKERSLSAACSRCLVQRCVHAAVALQPQYNRISRGIPLSQSPTQRRTSTSAHAGRGRCLRFVPRVPPAATPLPALRRTHEYAASRRLGLQLHVPGRPGGHAIDYDT